ncbi:MAG: polysaccharide deacetylase family protein [Rhizobiaceae bacterium]|nr:polysaccharide deacetylase family protein [Rhizobiaceae bacterium]MCV0408200.1 polysaccharide deacetylase family protein [Rhizobiaceae bacterium]
MNGPETIRALGLDPSRRVALLHADDVGMCHGANASFLDLFRAGALTCGSVMVPCPWFPEIARAAAEDPSLDLGVHLTLTSEWAGYRWGPLTRQPKSSGLIDDEGYFHRQVAPLAAGVVAEAAEEEMRAQVERALAFGITPTHIDTHMGAALCPPLVDAYCRVGLDYRLPVLLPRRGDTYARVLRADPEAAALWCEAAARLEADGMPLVDDFRMTPGVPTEESDAAYRELVETLPDGMTFVALHPNVPGDIETVVPPRAHYRTDEHRILGDGSMARWLDQAGVQTIGTRALHELYLRNLAEA